MTYEQQMASVAELKAAKDLLEKEIVFKQQQLETVKVKKGEAEKLTKEVETLSAEVLAIAATLKTLENKKASAQKSVIELGEILDGLKIASKLAKEKSDGEIALIAEKLATKKETTKNEFDQYVKGLEAEKAAALAVSGTEIAELHVKREAFVESNKDLMTLAKELKANIVATKKDAVRFEEDREILVTEIGKLMKEKELFGIAAKTRDEVIAETEKASNTLKETNTKIGEKLAELKVKEEELKQREGWISAKDVRVRKIAAALARKTEDASILAMIEKLSQ